MLYLCKLLKQVYTSLYDMHSLYSVRNIRLLIWFMSTDSITSASTHDPNTLIPLLPFILT
jgi:hypothetical protein